VHRLRSAVMMAAAAAAMLIMIPTAAANASVTAPAAPAGFKAAPVNLATDPGASVQTITLTKGECTALNHSHPGTVPNCKALLYTDSGNHEALPAGTAKAIKDASSGYWYWWGSKEECSLYSCHYWSVHLTMDGVANGSHVYQWNVGCTASGYDTSCAWHGYLYNGGGWPHYAMQFGENSNSCIGPYNIGCTGHGMRQWVNDDGYLTGYDHW